MTRVSQSKHLETSMYRMVVHACGRDWLSEWVRATYPRIWAYVYHVVPSCTCRGPMHVSTVLSDRSHEHAIVYHVMISVVICRNMPPQRMVWRSVVRSTWYHTSSTFNSARNYDIIPYYRKFLSLIFLFQRVSLTFFFKLFTLFRVQFCCYNSVSIFVSSCAWVMNIPNFPSGFSLRSMNQNGSTLPIGKCSTPWSHFFIPEKGFS